MENSLFSLHFYSFRKIYSKNICFLIFIHYLNSSNYIGDCNLLKSLKFKYLGSVLHVGDGNLLNIFSFYTITWYLILFIVNKIGINDFFTFKIFITHIALNIFIFRHIYLFIFVLNRVLEAVGWQFFYNATKKLFWLEKLLSLHTGRGELVIPLS